MKRIILTLLLLSVGLSYGQNFYNFTVSQSAYTDLTTPTSINNGQAWSQDEFGPFTIPFSFSIHGEAVNRFLFESNDFVFLTPNADLEEDTGVFYNMVTGAYIQDRTYSTSSSTSAISYKTEGEAGNRILKLEVRNAGLLDAEFYHFPEDHFYLNFQVWLYERGNIIEYRYGNHNITDLTVLDDEVLVGFFDNIHASILNGSSIQPTYSELNSNNPPDEEFYPILESYPSSGTVYRFAPASIAGINTFSKKAFVLYPNPVQDNLHITKIESDANYEVFSVLGAKVLSGTISAGGSTINVESLDKGVYIIKIGNAVQKFIKQ